jgi:sialic acid synthase SpsE
MTSNEFQIRDRKIGVGHPVYVIAEIGFNHNGDMDLAMQMLEAAVSAGVDAVKFQTYEASDLVEIGSEHYDIIQKGALNLADHQRLAKRASELGVEFLSTPFSNDAVDLLLEIGVNAFKVASMDVTNDILLAKIAKTGLPVILSTGMATEDEIKQALSVLNENGCKQISLLHCMSLYPTPDENAELLKIASMKMEFEQVIGFSDHTLSNLAPIAAVVTGAKIIEKHFTTDKNLPGPDNEMAADTEQMRSLVNDIKKLELMMRSPDMDESRADRQFSSIFRRGVYAAKDLQKGDVLSSDAVKCIRPESTVAISNVGSLIGKVVRQDVVTGESIVSEMLE